MNRDIKYDEGYQDRNKLSPNHSVRRGILSFGRRSRPAQSRGTRDLFHL